ncbi:MAG: polyprenyl synthetase family protein [Dehalococcoidales bacterium]|nr:polyprenyl synthetase family protein [Dehalococcoidales bacterium]
MELKQIYTPIQKDLDKVKDTIKSISLIDYKWLSEQLSYIVSETGKGIRPALTLISGKLFHYDLNYLMPMAVSVELMHTATLVHDDAIDKALTRRGQETINSRWGDEIAILMGDFLFAKAGEFVADTQTPRVIKLFSQTLGIISSGEIGQFRGAYNINQDRESYFQRIYRKTGSLFSLSTQSGAILGKAPEAAVTIMREYADNLGIAFQIVDDILDFTSTEEALGKPVGSDLRQGTLTLPAIFIIERNPRDNPVKRFFASRDKRDAEEAIDTVRNSGVIKECYKIAGEYCEKACRNLKVLPQNDSRQALYDLAKFVISQGK